MRQKRWLGTALAALCARSCCPAGTARLEPQRPRNTIFITSWAKELTTRLLTGGWGEPWCCQPVAQCPRPLCRDTSGRGAREGCSVLSESPGGSCDSSSNLGRQQARGQLEMAGLAVLKGCPGGAGSCTGRAELAPGGAGSQEGSLSQGPGEMLCTRCKASRAFSLETAGKRGSS